RQALIAGDGDAMRRIADRLDGRAITPVEVADTTAPLYAMPIAELRAMVQAHLGQQAPQAVVPWHARGRTPQTYDAAEPAEPAEPAETVASEAGVEAEPAPPTESAAKRGRRKRGAA